MPTVRVERVGPKAAVRLNPVRFFKKCSPSTGSGQTVYLYQLRMARRLARPIIAKLASEDRMFAIAAPLVS